MARVLYSFDLAVRDGGAAHVQLTSTGTANVQTATPPADAVGAFLTVSTNGAFLTFDGSTPSSTNGLALVKDTAPIFIPIASPRLYKFASQIAGNSVVNIVWVS